jgi:CDP-paratose 2-epimerase
VAHFLIRALAGRPITLYGDGRQVCDVLYVDDLVDAFGLALRHARTLAGQAFNVGGGSENTLSLLELLDLIGRLRGERPQHRVERLLDWLVRTWGMEAELPPVRGAAP